MKGLVSEDTKVLCHCGSKTQKVLCQTRVCTEKMFQSW